MSESTKDNTKLPLPQFLKVLTNGSIPMQKAMTFAAKLYKEYNTPETLSQLTDRKLRDMGIETPEDINLVVTALSKAGYISRAAPSSSRGQSSTASTRREPVKKRKHSSVDTNELLPDGPTEEDLNNGPWDFKESANEEEIDSKTCIINRAPVMMAWAMLVAERMCFTRGEALSIASVYTELNAVSKGVTLGIYTQDDDRGREAAKDGAQPYVELIGRRIPLYRASNGQWRALSNCKPITPNSAFQYIRRAFKHMTPFVIGAMKLLADSYSPKELDSKAWSLYADFRPNSNEWGKRAEMRCSTVLGLRKQSNPETVLQDSMPRTLEANVCYELVVPNQSDNHESSPKKMKINH